MTSTSPTPISERVRTTAKTPFPVGVGRAHAKAILFGEHAVVYGAPAVAFPIPQLTANVQVRPAPRGIQIGSALYSGTADDAPEHLLPLVAAVRASLSHVGAVGSGIIVRIVSTIPHERGLGSSAAVAAAVARAVCALNQTTLSAQECHAIVQVAEKVAHGSPSGLDAHTVIGNGPIRFTQGVVASLELQKPLTFVIADSGVPGSTAEAVSDVRSRRNAHPVKIERVLARLAEGAQNAIAPLQRGDLPEIGSLMRDAHERLSELGVSTPGLDKLVNAAMDAGAHGAKLTGGGLGGCIIALADSPEQAEELEIVLRQAGSPRAWTTTVEAA